MEDGDEGGGVECGGTKNHVLANITLMRVVNAARHTAHFCVYALHPYQLHCAPHANVE